ncbi:hypothetical protein CBR_g8094 [Chara braunii]|uniref:Uncharacterized protein n=1 Tax=Chara braunii TaxID=69332 RepID=A0A388KL64_CHABU|nr:hypothetical protein CBR_g8094 [Chara braunii]|eukprot:GBG70794.1 hypothetical protein CBR_g8094 [Chara braunii]
MADVFRKLPLLLLVVILLVVVVFVHVCILGKLPSRTRRKGGARKSVAMDGRRPTQRTVSAPYPSDRAPICAGVDRRAAGPSPYEGLSPNLQPLPDSDEGEAEVDVSTTVPLGSGSTQEWTGSRLYDRRGTKYGQSFTSLLHDGAEEEDCLPPVDLTFGLRSGSPSFVTRTVLMNPHRDADPGQVTFGGRGTRGGAAAEVTRVWKEARQELQRQQEESITKGVERLRVGERSGQADVAVGGGDAWANAAEVQCDVDDDDSGDVFPLRAPNMGGRGGRGSTSTRAQFKKVHAFMGMSGKEDFFQLTSQQRAEKGFNFNMDRAVFEEIKGARERSHTISPTNVADTGGAGGVQLPSAQSATPESMEDGEAAGEGNDEDDSSARGGSQTSGGPVGFEKRKNVRQKTFKALSECMDKHGALMASRMESASRRQCETMESASKRQCSI